MRKMRKMKREWRKKGICLHAHPLYASWIARTDNFFPEVQKESICLYSPYGSTSKYEVHLRTTLEKWHPVFGYSWVSTICRVWHPIIWLPSCPSNEVSSLWLFLFSSLAHLIADKNNVWLMSTANDTWLGLLLSCITLKSRSYREETSQPVISWKKQFKLWLLNYHLLFPADSPSKNIKAENDILEDEGT